MSYNECSIVHYKLKIKRVLTKEFYSFYLSFKENPKLIKIFVQFLTTLQRGDMVNGKSAVEVLSMQSIIQNTNKHPEF